MAKVAKKKKIARVNLELSVTDNGTWADISINGKYACLELKDFQIERLVQLTGLEVKDMRGSGAVKAESESEL